MLSVFCGLEQEQAEGKVSCDWADPHHPWAE